MGSNNCISYVARYNSWSQGNTAASWVITLPDPTTSYDFPYEVGIRGDAPTSGWALT